MRSRALLPLLGLLAPTAPAAAQEAAAPDPLDARVETVDFREARLEDALRLLSEEAGVNLVPSQEAGQRSVSLFLQDVSVRQAIEALALTYGLWYREDEASRIVRLLTADEFERDLRLFRDERTAVFTLLFPNALDVAVAVRNLFGDRVSLSFDRELRFDEYDELSERLRRFDLLDRRAQGQRAFGGNNVSSVYGNALTSSFQRQSDQRLDDYGRQPARRSSAADGEGYDLTAEDLRRAQEGGTSLEELAAQAPGQPPTIFVTVLRRTNRVAVRSADSAAMREIERVVRELDVPTPQVLLEVRVLELDLANDFASVFDFQFADGKSSGGFTTGDLVSNAGLFDPGALAYRFVDERFRARIQLLESDGRVTALATPVLLVANNEVARLFIGEERPLVRSISSQTIVSENVTTTTPSSTVELRTVGTTLLLTPNVNADRTVTLRVVQETSEVQIGAASIPVILSDGGIVEQPVDTITSRSLTGTVVAKDGLTLALGGLVEERLADVREGVPLLMDLPLLGPLFRRERKQRSRRELLVLVRPYVLFTSAEGDAISRDLARRLVIHPGAESADAERSALGTFEREEAPRPPLGRHPLLESLRFQSGLPDGGGR